MVCYNGAMRSLKSQSKHMMIFETLRGEILGGAFGRIGRLPSEAQLVTRFGVSRPTVVRAMQELEHGGFICRRRGSGTYLTKSARNATGRLGMLFPGHPRTEIFTVICSEIARCCQHEGYSLLFGDVSARDARTRIRQVRALAEEYVNDHVAGVFLEPLELVPGSSALTREIISYFDAAHIPVVLIDRDIEFPPLRSEYDLVGIDNENAGQVLTRHLLEQGARRIFFLMHPDSAPTVLRRVHGVMVAVVEAARPWSAEHVVVADPEDAKAVRKMVARRPDAVICGNDVTAAKLMQTLAAVGKRVPGDVLVAGFDDVRCASLVNPPLTTVRQPCDDIACVAVRTLLERIRNPELPAKEIQLPVRLVVRESTRRKTKK